MKRRLFIATTSIAVIGLPVAYYFKKNMGKGDPLTTADMLSHFCDARTLKDIGLTYRKLVPAENEKQKLTDILLINKEGKKLKPSDESAIEKLISEKIHEDFLTHQTLVLNQWVISVTEARQCALFSFI